MACQCAEVQRSTKRYTVVVTAASPSQRPERPHTSAPSQRAPPQQGSPAPPHEATMQAPEGVHVAPPAQVPHELTQPDGEGPHCRPTQSLSRSLRQRPEPSQ